MLSYSGLKKVSIYCPATGVVVQCDNVSSEGSYEKIAYVQENIYGDNIYIKDEAKFEFGCFDFDNYPQLEVWMQNRIKVRLVTYGLSDHILWYEDSYIQVSKDYGIKVGSRNAFKVTITKKGSGLSIVHGTNLLQLFSLWEEDENTSDVKDYVFAIDSVHSFNNGIQTLKFITDKNIRYSKFVRRQTPSPVEYGFVYPISGVSLKFERTDIVPDEPYPSNISVKCDVSFFTYANTETTSTPSVNSTSNTVSFVTPPTTYFIDVIPAWFPTGDNDHVLVMSNFYLGC